MKFFNTSQRTHHQKRWLLFLFLIGVSKGSLAIADIADNFPSIIEISNVKSVPTYNLPWDKGSLKTQRHLGVYIGEGQFLMSAWDVSHTRLLEGSFFGSPQKYPLTLQFVDHIANIAIVKIDQSRLDFPLKPATLGDRLTRGEEVELLSPQQEGGRLLLTFPLRLQDIRVRQSGKSNYGLTHYLFESRRQTGFGWSEPIFKKGRLVALAVGQKKSIVYSLPIPVIKRVLKDFKNPPYQGFIRLGFKTQDLSSVFLRQYLQASPEDGGILINKVSPTSSFFGLVKPNDILIAIGGSHIDQEGLIDDPHWGKIHHAHKINGFAGDDKVTLGLLRNGKKINTSATVPRYRLGQNLIPGKLNGDINYLIFGGLLFEELSQGYLESWGPNWYKKAPEELVYTYIFHNKWEKDETKKIIVLNKVFPDKVNKGYQGIRHQILTSVNDQKITSLSNLADALQHPLKSKGKDIAIFEFASGETIILPYKEVPSSHQRLARSFRIPSTGAFFSPSVGEKKLSP